jgi:cytochrome oxidase assembly protein ShyY1
MKVGEYVVLGFVTVMLLTFFSLYIWLQVKRLKRHREQRQNQLHQKA